MITVTQFPALVKALDQMPSKLIDLGAGGPYAACIAGDGTAFVPFADGCIEIYDESEYMEVD